jgi:uncharacterized membrane protein
MLPSFRLVLFLLLGAAAGRVSVSGEPSGKLVCGGHEPEWSLRIDGSTATLATIGDAGPTHTRFDGRLQQTAETPTAFVYRGKAASPGDDLVAVITSETCTDTMADPSEGAGRRPYTARVSLPDGATRLGCCSPMPTRWPAATTSPAAHLPATAGAATSAMAEAAPAGKGVIEAVGLPDASQCRRVEEGSTLRFRGERVSFDCGRSGGGGDTVALVGPLTVGPGGLLLAQRVVIEWRESLSAPPPVEPTPARVSEIALADGLTCRHAGTGATLAFEGRRASFTCGMKDGDTIALLGDLEPVEGGFRVVRARIAHGESGFTLRSSDTILVTSPR